MKHKIKVQSPYGRCASFVGGVGGYLIAVAFGVTGIGALALIGGLATYGYLCGRYAPDDEIDAVKDINLEQSYRIAREMKGQSRIGERCYLEHSTSKTADGMTPLGSLLFGKKINVTRHIEED